MRAAAITVSIDGRAYRMARDGLEVGVSDLSGIVWVSADTDPEHPCAAEYDAAFAALELLEQRLGSQS